MPETQSRRSFVANFGVILLSAVAGAVSGGLVEEFRDQDRRLSVRIRQGFEVASTDPLNIRVRFPVVIENTGNVAETNIRMMVMFWSPTWSTPPLTVNLESVNTRPATSEEQFKDYQEQSIAENTLAFTFNLDRMTPGDTVELVFLADEDAITLVEADVQSDDVPGRAVLAIPEPED